jgi:hypothetical protein
VILPSFGFFQGLDNGGKIDFHSEKSKKIALIMFGKEHGTIHGNRKKKAGRDILFLKAKLSYLQRL